MGSIPNIAWQVIRPMRANSITWNVAYGIYISTAQPINGEKLTQLSNVPIGASMNTLYTVEETGVISGPSAGGTPSAFSIFNKFSKQQYLTFGLYQNAIVNGTEIKGNAISARPVVLESEAVITPNSSEKLYVWMQSQVVSNSVVIEINSPITEINFGKGVSEKHITYDSDFKKFIHS